MSQSLRTIRGAVLEECGREQPFQTSRPISISELDLDTPGVGELRVRIEVAGICHSDLSVVNGSRTRPTPMLLGHEASGIVEELGGGVSKVAIGDRVVLTFLPRCGICRACIFGTTAPCEVGSSANGAGTLLSGEGRLSRGGQVVHHHLGVSAFATEAVVSEKSVVRVEQDVPPDVAALLGCAVLTGGGAVKNAGAFHPNQSLAVVGLGGVGMAALLVGVAMEGASIAVIDSQREKLDRALELGASQAFLPQDIPTEFVADLVVEAAGNIRAFETAFSITAPGGKLVTVGLPDPAARTSISPLELVAQGKSIIGSYLGSSNPDKDIPFYVDLWKRGRLPLEGLISAEIDLEAINTAMDDLHRGEAIRQIIRFS